MRKQLPSPVTSLLQTVEAQLVPWARLAPRLLVGRATKEEFLALHSPLPPDVRIAPRALKGRRVSVRENRLHGNFSLITARWPDDKMLAARVPLLLCVVGGQLDMRIGDYSLHCPQGSFLLLPAESPRANGELPHLEEARLADGKCDLLWMRPSGGGVDCWICHSRGPRHWSQAAGETGYVPNREIALHIGAIAEEVRAVAPGWEQVCQGLLLALVTLLQRDLKAGRSHGVNTDTPEAFDVAGATALNWDPISRACKYVQSHLLESLTINQVAQAVYLSRPQFTKLFRRQTGQTFVEFLTECRLKEAQKLLCDTDFSVQAIARLVGLKPSRLRELFHGRVGMAPAEYRLRSRRADSTAER